MKKVLFPALAAMLTLASPAAFAGSGSWYVLADANTHACYAANRTAATGEQTMSGPFATQTQAKSAMGGILACGSQWQP